PARHVVVHDLHRPAGREQHAFAVTQLVLHDEALAADARDAHADLEPRWPADPAVEPDLDLADHVVDVLEAAAAGDLAPVGGARLLEVDERQRVVGVAHRVEVAEADSHRMAEAHQAGSSASSSGAASASHRPAAPQASAPSAMR